METGLHPGGKNLNKMSANEKLRGQPVSHWLSIGEPLQSIPGKREELTAAIGGM